MGGLIGNIAGLLFSRVGLGAGVLGALGVGLDKLTDGASTSFLKDNVLSPVFDFAKKEGEEVAGGLWQKVQDWWKDVNLMDFFKEHTMATGIGLGALSLFTSGPVRTMAMLAGAGLAIYTLMKGNLLNDFTHATANGAPAPKVVLNHNLDLQHPEQHHE